MSDVGYRNRGNNALEVHLAYIHMLQQCGVYRQLSVTSKWTLMSIGQDVCVFMTLQHLQQQSMSASAQSSESVSEWEMEQWLYSGEDRHQAWLQWLVTVLDAAVIFREERASVLYDVSPNQPPLTISRHEVPVWTRYTADTDGLVEAAGVLEHHCNVYCERVICGRHGGKRDPKGLVVVL